jgi:hypothetical protein
VPFWTAHGVNKSLASILAPKWYKYPASQASAITKQLGDISPSQLSQCIASDKDISGKGETVSSGTYNGQSVVLLKSAGTQPGTAPGSIAIAATGKAYPLHIEITGPTKPGGPKSSSCGGSGGGFTGSLTMSHWDTPPTVKAPAGAIALPSKG